MSSSHKQSLASSNEASLLSKTIKGADSKYFGCSGPCGLCCSDQLCHCTRKAAIDNMLTKAVFQYVLLHTHQAGFGPKAPLCRLWFKQLLENTLVGMCV